MYAQPAKICNLMLSVKGCIKQLINVLRTLVHTNPSQNITQARDIIDDALATALHALQSTVATTLGSTSGALAFA